MKFQKCIFQFSVQHLANVVLEAWKTWNETNPVTSSQRIPAQVSPQGM